MESAMGSVMLLVTGSVMGTVNFSHHSDKMSEGSVASRMLVFTKTYISYILAFWQKFSFSNYAINPVSRAPYFCPAIQSPFLGPITKSDQETDQTEKLISLAIFLEPLNARDLRSNFPSCLSLSECRRLCAFDGGGAILIRGRERPTASKYLGLMPPLYSRSQPIPTRKITLTFLVLFLFSAVARDSILILILGV